jgi:hypothetical protein
MFKKVIQRGRSDARTKLGAFFNILGRAIL